MAFSRRNLLKVGLASGGLMLAPGGGQGQEALAESESAAQLAQVDAATSGGAASKVVVPNNCNSLTVDPANDHTDWTPFGRELPRPERLTPVARRFWPTVDLLGIVPVEEEVRVDYYEISMEKAIKDIGGNNVEIWGYNGQMPGPIIYRQKDVESVVRFINNLEDSCPGGNYNTYNSEFTPGVPRVAVPDAGINALIHLHGMASKPQYDGYADDFIPPGYYKDYHYPNDRAATLWYHDHVAGRTQRNVGMGLAGMYIVEGPEEDYLNHMLPSDYGFNDIPLILQTNPLYVNIDAPCKWNGKNAKTANVDASCNYNPTSGKYPDYVNGKLPHDSLLVNGELSPKLTTERRRYRFRVLNATDKDGLVLSLVDSTGNPIEINGSSVVYPSIVVIGTDGGLLKSPARPITELPIAMGERYEIIIDFNLVYELIDDANGGAGTNDYNVFLQCTQLSAYGCPNGASWNLMMFHIGKDDVNDETSIPSDLCQGFRPFPCEECATSRVNLTFQQDGPMMTVNGDTIYPAACTPSSTPDNTPLTPGSSILSFVIGDGDGVRDPQSGRVTGKSWMEGEPLDPFPPLGTAPVFPGTTLPNVEHRIIPRPELGEAQIWELVNESTQFHPVHIHLLDTLMLKRSKRVSPADGVITLITNSTTSPPGTTTITVPAGLDLCGLQQHFSSTPNVFKQIAIDALDWSDPQPPHPWEKNWKDVYLLAPGEKIEIIGTFGPHKGRYMMHCHNLSHEDCDMMIEFEVMPKSPDVTPGDDPLSDPAKDTDLIPSPIIEPDSEYILGNQPPVYDFISDEGILQFNEAVYGLSSGTAKKHFSLKARSARAEQKAKVKEELKAKLKAGESFNINEFVSASGGLFGAAGTPTTGMCPTTAPEEPGGTCSDCPDPDDPWSQFKKTSKKK